MKKLNRKFKLWITAGLVAIYCLAAMPQLMAQTENVTPRKVKVKIFENINGQTSVRDTVLEISGNQAMAEPMEIRKQITRFSPEDGERLEKLSKELKAVRQPVEINRIDEVAADSEIPQQVRIHRIKQVPRTEFAAPDSLRKFLRIEQHEAGKIRNMENFRIDRKALENLEENGEFKMLMPTGDSVKIYQRFIIVEHDITEPEKALLNTKAREKTAASKIKDLDLEAVNLYPNPNTGKFKITFKALKKGNTSVVLMDNLGRELYRDELGNFSGTYEKEFNLEKQAKGTYYLQVIQGRQVFNKKVLVQ